jgi:hypothetical protein
MYVLTPPPHEKCFLTPLAFKKMPFHFNFGLFYKATVKKPHKKFAYFKTKYKYRYIGPKKFLDTFNSLLDDFLYVRARFSRVGEFIL